MKTTMPKLKRIIRKILIETSGTKGSYDSFGDVVGGQQNSRGRMIPAGGSEILTNAKEAWDFICDMGAPNVSPSFWEDGKLMRFDVEELEDLLDSLLGMSGPGTEQWNADNTAANTFIEKLEDHISLVKQI